MNFSKKLLCLSLFAVIGLSLLLFVRSAQGFKDQASHTLMMYCAAGVKPPVLKAAAQFKKRHNVNLELQYGGSGTLLNNLQLTQQGDLYLAADVSFLEIAKAKGLIKETLPLAKMKPVIAVQKGNPKGITVLKDLLRSHVRLSLGNPEAASIGKQTKQLLSSLGMWEDIKKHVEQQGVFKTTVTDIANDIKIGAVDAGIVWDATVNQYHTLVAVEIPEFSQEEKMISIGILNSSKQVALAWLFAKFLSSEVGNEIFNSSGYRAVNPKKLGWTATPFSNINLAHRFNTETRTNFEVFQKTEFPFRNEIP